MKRRDHIFRFIFVVFLSGLIAFPGSGKEQSGNLNLEYMDQITTEPFVSWAKNIGTLRGCAAILVASDLLMTSLGCEARAWDKPLASDAEFWLEYSQRQEWTKVKRYKVIKTEVFSADRFLNYALYRVQPINGGMPSFSPPTLSHKGFDEGTSLALIGHFAGGPDNDTNYDKKIDRSQECLITKKVDLPRKNFFAHGCDTDAYSGGSPIFEKKSGHMLGMHWGVGTLDGKKHNVALSMQRVLDDLKMNHGRIYRELVVAE